MKFEGIQYFSIMLVFLLFGCKNSGDQQQAEKVLNELKDNQAKVIIRIDGKEFYPDSSIFTGQLMLTEQMLSLALTDQYEGKTMLNVGGEKWFAEKPVSRQVVGNNAFNAGLKLGKLVDPQNMIGEGYMMTEGKIEAVIFEKDRIVFSINGKAGKYSDFQQPDKYLPLEGLIIFKKPALNLANITEKEVFGATTTR